MDIAQLGFEVDSSQVVTAENRLEKMGATGTKATDKLSNSGNKLGKVFTGLSGILASVGIASLISDTKKYQTAIAEVSTLVDTTSFNMSKLSGEALKQSARFGTMPTDNAKAFYQAISAGASTAEKATEALTASNKLAVGGVTTTTVAVDGLTSTMNAYAGEAGSFTDISDAMFIGMKAGKTTIAELSANIGGVAPLAAQAGASFDEVISATAALTKGGVSTSTSMQGLRAILASVVKPSKEATEMAADLGLEFNAAALKSKGLAGFLEDLADKTGGSTEKMAMLFGGVEALTPVLALTGGASKDFTDTLEAMGEKAGATDEAFQKMTNTADYQGGRIAAGLMAAWVMFSKDALDSSVPALKFLADGVESLSEYIEEITFVLTGLTIVAGVSLAFIGLGKAISLVTALIAANPIVFFVTAIATSAYLIYDHWDGIVSWWGGLWADISSKASAFLNWWNNTTFDEKSVDVLTFSLIYATDAANVFIDWWNGSFLATWFTPIDNIRLEDVAQAAGDFADWWSSTTFEEKALNVQRSAVEMALTAANGFSNAWNETWLAEWIAPIDNSSILDVESTAQKFIDWWGATTLKEWITPIASDLLDDAEDTAYLFIDWWNTTTLDEKLVDVRTTYVDAAFTVAEGFINLWNGSILAEWIMPIDASVLDDARTAADTLFKWWDTTSLKEKVADVKTVGLTTAIDAANSFSDLWNGSVLAEWIAPIDNSGIVNTEEAAAKFYNWWDTTNFKEKTADIVTASITGGLNLTNEFVETWNGSILAQLITPIDNSQFKDVEKVIRDFFAWWDTTLGPNMISAAGDISAALSKAWTDISSGLGVAFVDMKKIWDELKLTFSSLMSFFSTDTETGLSAIKSSFETQWGHIKGVVEGVWNIIKGVVKTAWDGITGLLTVGLRVLRGDWDGAWSGLKDVAKTTFQNVKNIFSGAMTDFGQFGKDIVNGLVGGIAGAANKAAKAASDLAAKVSGSIKDFFGIKSPSKLMEGFGGFIAGGLAEGIKKKAMAVVKVAKDMAGKIAGSIKDFFGIKSPSKLMSGYGSNVSEGLAVGIKSASGSPVKEAEAVTSRVANTFNSVSDRISKEATKRALTTQMLASAENVASASTQKLAEATKTAQKAAETFNRESKATVEEITKSSAAVTKKASKTKTLKAETVKLTDAQRSGLAMTKALRSDQEKYDDALANANGLLKAGTISQETYNREVSRASKALSDSRVQTVKLSDSQKSLNSLYDSVITPLEKYNKKKAELDELAKVEGANIELINRARVKERESYEKSAPAIQEKIKAQESLNKLYESVATPLEKYNKKKEELDKLSKIEGANLKLINLAREKEKAAYEKTVPAIQERIKAQKEQAKLSEALIKAKAGIVSAVEKEKSKLDTLNVSMRQGADAGKELELRNGSLHKGVVLMTSAQAKQIISIRNEIKVKQDQIKLQKKITAELNSSHRALTLETSAVGMNKQEYAALRLEIEGEYSPAKAAEKVANDAATKALKENREAVYAAQDSYAKAKDQLKLVTESYGKSEQQVKALSLSIKNGYNKSLAESEAAVLAKIKAQKSLNDTYIKVQAEIKKSTTALNTENKAVGLTSNSYKAMILVESGYTQAAADARVATDNQTESLKKNREARWAAIESIESAREKLNLAEKSYGKNEQQIDELTLSLTRGYTPALAAAEAKVNAQIAAQKKLNAERATAMKAIQDSTSALNVEKSAVGLSETEYSALILTTKSYTLAEAKSKLAIDAQTQSLKENREAAWEAEKLMVTLKEKLGLATASYGQSEEKVLAMTLALKTGYTPAMAASEARIISQTIAQEKLNTERAAAKKAIKESAEALAFEERAAGLNEDQYAALTLTSGQYTEAEAIAKIATDKQTASLAEKREAAWAAQEAIKASAIALDLESQAAGMNEDQFAILTLTTAGYTEAEALSKIATDSQTESLKLKREMVWAAQKAIEESTAALDLETSAVGMNKTEYKALIMTTQGYTETEALAKIATDNQTSSLEKKRLAVWEADKVIKDLKEKQHLLNIEMTQGKEASEAAAMSLKGYDAKQVETIQTISAHIEKTELLKSAYNSIGETLIEGLMSGDWKSAGKSLLETLGTTFVDPLKKQLSSSLSTAMSGGGTSGFSSMFSTLKGGGMQGSMMGGGLGMMAGQMFGQTGIGSGIGAAIGTAVMGPIGTAIGSVLGGVAEGLFGGDKTQTGAGVELSYGGSSGLTGRSFEEYEKEKSFFRGTKRWTDYKSLDSQVANQVGGYFDRMEAGISDQFSAFGLSSENILSDFVINPKKFSGENIESDINEWLGESTRRAYHNVFLKLDATTRRAINRHNVMAEDGEAIAARFEYVGQIATNVTPVLEAMGLKIGYFSGQQILASVRLVDALGGASEAMSALSVYSNSFFSESEKFGATFVEARDKISQFNESLGRTGARAITTKEGLRAYIEGLDLTTDAGANAAASAISAAGAMDVFAGSISGIKDMFNSTIASIELDLMSQAEKTEKYMTEAGNLFEQLKAESDPSRIAEISEQINSAVNSAWSTMTEDQKEASAEYLTSMLTASSNFAEQSLLGAMTSAEQMTQAINGLNAPASIMSSAADLMLSAASSMPSTINVNVAGAAANDVNAYASGGYYPGGLALVGENGPEMINFDTPGYVYNARETEGIINSQRNVANTNISSLSSADNGQKDQGAASMELLKEEVRLLRMAVSDGNEDRNRNHGQSMDESEDRTELLRAAGKQKDSADRRNYRMNDAANRLAG